MGSRTHGLTGTRSHMNWKSMRQKCFNQSNISYQRFGGAGIGVCQRWEEFANFYADMGDCPAGHSLMLLDRGRDFSPDNCRWATRIDAAADVTRLGNRCFEIEGGRKTGAELSRRNGLESSMFYERIRAGWSVEQALARPTQSEERNRLVELVGSSEMLDWLRHRIYMGTRSDILHGVVSDLTVDYIAELFADHQGLCAHSRLPLGVGYSDLSAATIDRIDSEHRHLQGNVQLSQLWLNRGKSNLPDRTFCELLDEHRGLRPFTASYEPLLSETSSAKSRREARRRQRTMRAWLMNQLSKLAANDRKHHRPFALTIDDLLNVYEAQGRLCAVSFQPMLHQRGNPRSASIDTIIPELGHVRGNIQLTQVWINLAKSGASDGLIRQAYSALRASGTLWDATQINSAETASGRYRR